MNIEIHNTTGDTRGYKIYAQGAERPMRNFRAHMVDLHGFTDDDIQNLLSASDYKKFENGQYKFNVSKSRLELVTGERLATTKAELELYQN